MSFLTIIFIKEATIVLLFQVALLDRAGFQFSVFQRKAGNFIPGSIIFIMAEKEQQNTEGVTVAYADDHTAVRKGIIAYLHELGGVKVVMEAEDGQDLIDKMIQSPKLPDVCIVDINMPRMNGFETVGNIRKKWRHQKVLVLSTYDEEMYVVQMIKAGANGYLPKACNPDEIKKAILSIHEKGHYYSEFYMEKTMGAIMDDQLTKRSRFTEKELTFLKYTCSDLTYRQIAQRMQCSAKSVEGFRDSLFKKIGVNNRVSLAVFAIKMGLVLI